MKHFGISGIITVGQIQADDGRPVRVVQGTTRLIIQLHSLKGVRVFLLDAQCDRGDDRVIGRNHPFLEVVAVQPNDVGKVFVTVAQIPSIGPATIRAVGERRSKEPRGFKRINHQHNVVRFRHSDDLVHVGKISFIRRGQVVATCAGDGPGEGLGAVQKAGVGAPLHGSHAKQIHPHAVHSTRRPVGQKSRGAGRRNVGKQGVGRISRYHEWSVVLIHQNARIRAADF